MSKINVTLGFDADTSQAQRRINELATSLRQLSAHPVELLDDTDLRDAIKAAKELETHLHKAYNVDTQKLDLSKFSKSLSAAGQDLNYFQKNLSKMGVDGEKAFLNLAKAIAIADAPTFRLSGHVKNLFNELVKVGRWQFTSSVMHSLTGAVQTAYYYAQDLNESLTNIRIVTGQSTEEMAQFADKANAAAKALSTTTVKYSDAALIYYQQGLDEQQIEERTAATIKMANVTGQSVETISDQLTSIWNNYYDGSKSLEYYADVLTRLGADTASSSDEITEGLQKFSAVADTVGLSYEYAASALATVTATTRESANTVGTAFKTLFSRIQGLKLGDTLDDGTDLNKYSAALASVGVNIKDTNGDLKEMDTILDEVGTRWSVLSKDQQMALAQTVAGVRQYTQFIALMDNWDYFQENLNLALNATGSLGEQAEIYADSWQAAEDKVRASAEGIYKALINEETFIDLNNGLANILQGIDGVVTGMGGMKGVLTTIGSLFLMTYSKEIPSAIDKAIGTLDILTGKAKKNMAVMQQQNINALTEFTGGGRSAQVEADGLAKVARMKKELTDKSHMLSKAQIEEYQSKIQSIQGDYQKVQALYEEAKAQENLLERTEINYDQKMTRSVKDLALSLNDSWKQMENLANRFAQEEDENIITSIIEDMDILQKRINDTNEALKSLGLDDDEILRFRTNFDPTQKKQVEEVDVVYKKITKSIEEQRKKIVSLTKEQEKYRIIGKTVEDMKTVWDKNTNSVDKAKQAIKEYLKDLEAISKKENIKIDFSEDSMIGSFLADLDKAELSADQLKQKFSEVLEEIIKVNTEGIADTNADMEVLENQVHTILNLMGQGDKFDSFFEVLRTQGAEAATTSLKASMAEEELKKQQEERIKIQAKLSSGIGEMAAQLMNINGLLASVDSISKLWNDEDASTLEKITATMGLFYQQGQLVVGMYKAMTTVGEALTAIKLKKASAEGVDAAATKINTEVTKENTKEVNKNKIAVMSHPYLAIAAIAIMAIVTAIGAASAAWDKHTKKIKENAEEAKKVVDESKAQVEANTDLIRSMEEALEAYKKTGERKEELDGITNSLAEAYGLEGAALAKLSGEYKDYQAVLDRARKKQIEELEDYRQDTQKAKNNQKEAILYTAREDRGVKIGDTYEVALGGFRPRWDSEKNAESIMSRYVTGFDKERSTAIIDFNIDSIIKLYDELKKAKEAMNKELSDEEIATSAIYKDTSDWLNKMSESIEIYKSYEQTINTINTKLNYSDLKINNYEDYTDWAKAVRAELSKTIADAEEAEKVFQSILDLSPKSNLNGFYEIEKAIKDIKETGTKVSEETLINLFKQIENGTSAFDAATLASLNWGAITEESLSRVLNLAIQYEKVLKGISLTEDIKAGATQLLDFYKNDEGITISNWEEASGLIDWGNEEKNIIEFTDFLELTVEEQKKYLENLATQSLIPQLEQKIKVAKETITEYQDWLNSNETDINDAQKIQTELDDLKKIYNYYNSIYDDLEIKDEEFFNSLKEALSEIDFALLGLDKLNAYQFETYLKDDGKDFYKDLIEGSEKISESEILLNAAFDYENSIEELQDEIDSEQERIVILAKLEVVKEKTENYLKDLDLLMTLTPDTTEYDKVLKRLLEADNSVKVNVSGEMDDQLEKVKEDLDNIKSAASTIGDNFIVSAEDIETLSSVFPGILANAKIVEEGMIQLDSSIAQGAIDTAKIEADASQASLKDRLEAQNIVLREQIKASKNREENYRKTAEKESLTELEIAKLKAEIAEQTTDKFKEEDSNRVESSNETTDDEIKNQEQVEDSAKEVGGNIATAFAEGYDSSQFSAAESAALQGSYAFAIASMNKAAAEGNPEAVQQILNTLPAAKKAQIISSYKPNLKEEFLRTEQEYNDPNEGQESPSAVKYAKLEQDIRDYLLSLADKEAEDRKELEDQLASNENALALLDLLDASTDKILNNVKSGLGSDGKSDGSSKSQKDEKLSDEVDIYRDIDNEIEYINDKLDEQEKILSRVKDDNVEYYKALEEQEKLLDDLIAKQKQKKGIVEQELKTLKDQILNSGKGFIIDDSTGLITNSVSIFKEVENNINNKIKELNAAQGEEVREALEKEKEALENEKESLENLIDNYEDTLELLRNLNVAITEAEYDKIVKREEFADKLYEEALKEAEEKEKELEENFKKLKTELNLKIQIDENSLKKLDYYLDKLSDDFYQMAEAMEIMIKKVPVMENSLGNYENFYNKLQTAWADGDINSDDYLEGLQQSYDGILDNLSSLVALDKEMIHYYGDTLAAAEDELSHYTDSLEHLTSVLEHYKNIIELVDGEYNFEGVDTILRGQAKTIENQMQVAESNYQLMLRQKEMAEEAIRGVDRDSAAWEVLNNKLQAATEAVNRAEEEMLSKTKEWAEAMKAVMENTFAEAAHNMEMAMTQGMGFDMLNGSLDRLSAWQDVYLTTTNKIYETTKLMRTAQQAADKTDNVASKQKLNNYIKEIEGLRDKTNLSKLDLDLAKARYDVLLAEIALEEAQNAKSTVRLQRDSEGNFGYVYTSDTDAITSAEQDLADAQNKLYNIGLDATNEYGEKMLELQQKLSDDLMQLEQDRANGRFAIEGSYEAARDQLIQQYRDLFIAYSEQYTTALGSDINIQEEAWINAYDSMINQTQNWADYTEEYTNVCENAYEQWRDAVTEHNEVIQDVLNNTKGKVDDVTAASDNLKDEVLGEVLPAIENELDMVADLSDNYAHLRDEILETIRYYEDLIDTIEELIRKQAEAKIDESTAEYDISGVKDFSQAMADYLANGGKTTDGWYQALLKGRDEKLKQNGYSQFDGEAATNLKTLMLKYERYKAEGVTNDLTEYVESIDRNAGEYFDPDEVRRLIATFASGGYTGSWGPSGRLAVLHEKELVLNANDTLHFLQAAEILRGVSEAIDLQAMANQTMLNPYVGALTSTLADQTLQQQVTIEANFPGVTDRFEIEEAFNNLINTASQYANRK